MKAFLRAAGVAPALIDKYGAESKYPMARHILSDLADTDGGPLVQRKLLTALCNLRDLPDRDVPDRDAGLEALRDLKHLAVERDLVVRRQKEKQADRAKLAEERENLVRERAAKLAKLRDAFNAAVLCKDRQEAGFDLEDILAELFALSEIEYTRSYRTGTQQIDGHFAFLGFDYLVEAKWQKDPPTEGEIGAFQRKVETKLESTRGVFLSVPGYRPEVAAQFDGRGANIILMDGQHLTHVLEGRRALRDVLRLLIDAAAQRGAAYTPLH
ncbi:MAG TPA: restriction endonuclease [Tepidisphaeraceae bacterium]|nr:restriction endonuclease [Tepidisphaeraceae bacterium]